VHGQIPADSGFVTSIVNLATTTSSYHETFATLTKDISTLVDQLVAKDMWSESKETKLKRLLDGHAPAMVTITMDLMLPTSGSLTRPRMKITFGSMSTRLGWITQVPDAPIKLRATRMNQPMKKSLGRHLG
jgi:hypothetical protein